MDKPSRIYYGPISGEVRRQSGKDEDNSSEEEEMEETLEFSTEIAAARDRKQQLLEELAKRKRARRIAVPTDDTKVKAKLREVGHPIILFAEQPPERRERLREILASVQVEEPTVQPVSPKKEQKAPKEELFYTEGTQELRTARRWIADYSLNRAKERIQLAKKRNTEEYFTEEFKSHSKRVKVMLKFENESSQIGDRRTLSYCEFSPDSSLIATSSWTGLSKIWSTATCECELQLKGHMERVCSVSFHPEACKSQYSSAANIITSSADSTAKLWSLESSNALATLSGHARRCNRAKFHPSGYFAGTTSHDLTWRLWDLETQSTLVIQEGHSRGVYALAFHPDASLAATGGLDAVGRVWDLRTGKSIMVLRGHAKQLLATDFAPNGYQLATGGADHTVRIWDLRKRKTIYIIPAHSKTVSDVKFHPCGGNFIATSSFDGTVRLWSARDWSPIKTLAGHEGRVTCADFSKESEEPKYVLSSSSDRTWKLWSPSII